MISIENLERQLKEENLKGIYLLYGEELFLLENSLKKIKNIFGECIKGINYISLDETNINSLISDLETPAFGYDRKFIVAKDTGLFKKEKRTSKKTTAKEVDDVGKKKTKKRK